MKTSDYGRIIVNSTFTLGLMVGVSVGDTTLGTAVANLGWDEVRFPAPVFIGDTLWIETEVVDLRESRSRPDAGIVTFVHRAFNQRDELVATCKRTGLQRKTPAGAAA
jgi:acyl dehydratase